MIFCKYIVWSSGCSAYPCTHASDQSVKCISITYALMPLGSPSSLDNQGPDFAHYRIGLPFFLVFLGNRVM